MQPGAQTSTRVCFLAVCAGVLKVYVCDTKAPKKFSDIYIYFLQLVNKCMDESIGP